MVQNGRNFLSKNFQKNFTDQKFRARKPLSRHRSGLKLSENDLHEITNKLLKLEGRTLTGSCPNWLSHVMDFLEFEKSEKVSNVGAYLEHFPWG